MRYWSGRLPPMVDLEQGSAEPGRDTAVRPDRSTVGMRRVQEPYQLEGWTGRGGQNVGPNRRWKTGELPGPWRGTPMPARRRVGVAKRRLRSRASSAPAPTSGAGSSGPATGPELGAGQS